jgi:hypothetical protein
VRLYHGNLGEVKLILKVTGITLVNFVDITHAQAQQIDDTASSGELIYTISHTILFLISNKVFDPSKSESISTIDT